MENLSIKEIEKIIENLNTSNNNNNINARKDSMAKTKKAKEFLDKTDLPEESKNSTSKYIGDIKNPKINVSENNVNTSIVRDALKADLRNLELVNNAINVDKLLLSKYEIEKIDRPIIQVPIVIVKHNYIINMDEFESHRKNSFNRKNLDTKFYLSNLPKTEAPEQYKILKKAMSTEEWVVSYYKTKLYSNGTTDSLPPESIVYNLRERLNPTPRSANESVAEYKLRLAMDAVRGFYSIGSTIPARKFVNFGKKKIEVNREIVNNTFEPVSDVLNNSLFSYGAYGAISMTAGNFLNNDDHGQFVRAHIDLSSGSHNYTLLTDTSETKVKLRDSLKAFSRMSHNSAIECLLRSMPNFASNMYYGVFSQIGIDESDIFYSEDLEELSNRVGVESITKELGGVAKRVLSTYQVRLQSVNIPKASFSKNEVSFMGRKVPKVASKFSEEHTATLAFSLDQDGLILRQFDMMSGIFGYGKTNEDNESMYSKFLDSSNGGKYYPQTFFPSRFFESSNENKGRRLDLTIMYNDYRSHSYFEKHYNNKSSFKREQQFITDANGLIEDVKRNKVLGSYNSYRAFIFEDVKILGSASPLQFERDSSKSLTVQIPIVFKRIKIVDANP